MANKLIVVSIDALVYEDLEYLKTRPNFQKLLASCAQVKRVKSIYPTLTYPCHATMATGCLPASMVSSTTITSYPAKNLPLGCGITMPTKPGICWMPAKKRISSC